MNQLIFQFPFRTSYFEKDFFVSSNNFDAYKLIESCPEWPDKKINIYGPRGCGKTHLSSMHSVQCENIYFYEYIDILACFSQVTMPSIHSAIFGRF